MLATSQRCCRDVKGSGLDWFDLPVHGGATTLAALGIPEDERATTVSLLARALHDRETKLTAAPAMLSQLTALTNAPMLGAEVAREVIEIPVPLDEATWRELLALPPDADLFARLITDRAALLLAAGLTATNASIRALVHRDGELLRFLYREGHGPLLLVSRALAVRDGHMAVPGGEIGRTVWTRLAGQPPTSPESFIRALLTRDRGRLAWYYDAIHSLDEARLAAAWPGTSPEARVAHAVELYEGFREGDPHWRAPDQPFRRAPADAWMVLTLSEIAEGMPTGSLPAALWERLFTLEPLSHEDARARLARGGPPLTLPGLVRRIASAPPRDRLQQFEMFRLYQRALSRDPNLAAVAAAVSGYGRFSSLLTALERMAVADPETWGRAVAAAEHVSDRADDAREALTAFQAAIAIVDRLRHVRMLHASGTDRALRALSDAVVADRQVTAAVARWVVDELLPLLPPLERPDAFTGATAYESRLLQALAGERPARTELVEWEGLTYVVDLAGAEHQRLYSIRKLVPSPGLDAAIAGGRPRDLAEALKAIVYAIALGHPDGAASLGRDVATRHDFGLRGSSLMRRMLPWARPEERQGQGPWHIAGAIIGLDSGLSRLALRRVADEQLPQAPTLTLNDFATLTRTLVGLVARELTDADRDAIAAAIDRGRQRVLDARDDPLELERLARQVRMSAPTRELLAWLHSRQPDALVDSFSLRDLLWLGGVPAGVDLDRWGVAGDAIDGRRTLMMPAPAPWEDFAGRPDAGQIATQVPDVTLRLVEETARLRLPASIVPALLAYAVEDYWHDVQARFADDWPRMIRQAAAIDSSRIEDYVAALVGDAVLRPQ